MKKTWRQILFFIFATTFIVCAPLIVLYTAGFRISLNNQRIQQTGALAVSTVPRGATVTVDQVLHSGKTPTVVQNISPSTVTVKLEKKGYTPWEARATVYPGRTTYVDAVLFAETEVELLPLDSVEPLVDEPSTSYELVMANNGSNVEVSTKYFETSKLVALLPSDIYTLLEQDEEFVILKNSRDALFVISLTSTDVTTLSEKATLFNWLPAEHLMVFSDGSEINLYDADNKEKTLLTRLSEPITALAFHPSGLAVIVGSAERIVAIDLKSYEKRVETTLVDKAAGTITALWLDEAGKNLYFTTTKEEQPALYRKRLVK